MEDAARFVARDRHYTVHYGHARSEIGNWRAAIRWALTERNDVLGGQRLVAEVVCLWYGRVTTDARRWISAAIELVDEQTPPDVIAKLTLAEAELATHLEQHALQLASAREAVAYCRDAGDALRLVRAQSLLGTALFGHGDAGRLMLEEALSAARKLGSRWDTWRVLRNLGYHFLYRDLVASRTYLTEALQLCQDADDLYSTDLMAMDFAELAFREGHAESAVRQLTGVFTKRGDFVTSGRWAVNVRLDMAEYLTVLGRYDEAREYASEALGAAREEQLDVHIADSVIRLASIAVFREPSREPDAPAKAARIVGFADARLRGLGSRPFFWRDPLLAALREALGAETLADLMAEGATITEDEAAESATAL